MNTDHLEKKLFTKIANLERVSPGTVFLYKDGDFYIRLNDNNSLINSSEYEYRAFCLRVRDGEIFGFLKDDKQGQVYLLREFKNVSSFKEGTFIRTQNTKIVYFVSLVAFNGEQDNRYIKKNGHSVPASFINEPCEEVEGF